MPERVHTMTDYYDGPRAGIADYQGQPHTYESLWLDFVDPPPDDWTNTFLLRAVDPGTFELAMESWSIWLRWRAAFDRGEATTETHPALPADRSRHDEIEPLIKAPTTGDLMVEWSV